MGEGRRTYRLNRRNKFLPNAKIGTPIGGFTSCRTEKQRDRGL
ncbi:hypothetical protein GG496_000534, partial [Candidatus Fervidibacteria bacterium JGI MDM2 JNZ-1-D12]